MGTWGWALRCSATEGLEMRHILSTLAIAVLLLTPGNALTAADGAPRVGAFEPAGTLAEARAMHSATLIPDGRVLVLGGTALSADPTGVLASVEMWDPTTEAVAEGDELLQARAITAPFLIAGLGILVSIAGVFIVRTGEDADQAALLA